MHTKQYIVERGTHVFVQNGQCATSGPLWETITFDQRQLVAADIEFLTFVRNGVNYTFHPDKVKVINGVL